MFAPERHAALSTGVRERGLKNTALARDPRNATERGHGTEIYTMSKLQFTLRQTVKRLAINGLFAALFAASAVAQPVPLTPGGIFLEKGWDTSMSDGVTTMKELKSLLSSGSSPAPNTAPAPEISIFGNVTYLMPLKDAIAALGLTQQVASKAQVACPGFPYHSLRTYSFNGNFDGGFNTLCMLADEVNQVVAIQFVTATPEKVRIEAPHTNKKWVTFDFANTRVKALSIADVYHGVESGGRGGTRGGTRGVVRIDSLLRVDGKAVNATRIYLPRPMVELILYRISKAGV